MGAGGEEEGCQKKGQEGAEHARARRCPVPPTSARPRSALLPLSQFVVVALVLWLDLSDRNRGRVPGGTESGPICGFGPLVHTAERLCEVCSAREGGRRFARGLSPATPRPCPASCSAVLLPCPAGRTSGTVLCSPVRPFWSCAVSSSAKQRGAARSSEGHRTPNFCLPLCNGQIRAFWGRYRTYRGMRGRQKAR